ncbi:HlyD family secretion protein [Bradyrhizobium sp. PMVTL-01]|uniref:HlyD family secretion protein n=1 Tax=Bradyrhizobium sp. PMVTL-01 TaxID=3434999 RepID=UPI003F71DAB0
MHQNTKSGTADGNGGRRAKRHPVILRASSLLIAGVLSVLLVSAVVPPIIADQSDRAVVNAPLTLLTAPIDGEIGSLSKQIGNAVEPGNSLALISNARVDKSALIALEQKTSDARAKLEATKQKKISDKAYVKALNSEIDGQTAMLQAQFQSQIVALRAKVAESDSLSQAKKSLVDRQSTLVARNAASMDMLNPTKAQYSAALHNADVDRAKLNQKIAQLESLQKGIYVGDDLVSTGTLIQKRRDIELDATRMEIEENELSAALRDQQALVDRERQRIASLSGADVVISTPGTILTMGVTPGRRVTAGDALASLVDCNKRFVVAIFSYRQAESMKVGTRVRIDNADFKSGTVESILPKTTDKVDERYAVPFPQTERRELYAIIAPDEAGSGAAKFGPAASSETTPCTVGQWVTVTKDKALVPSLSVTWSRVEKFIASVSADERQAPAESEETARRMGIAALTSAFRSVAAASQPSVP